MKKISYKTLLSAKLDNFKSDGFYREFTPILRKVESFPLTKVKFPSIKDKPKADLKIWCTNDYLNMSHNSQVIETMVEVIREVGTGSGGTRNISGTTPFHQNLESDLAKFHNREAALIFTSAYNANQTAIWTICKAFKDICVFSDELNHASLIQGIKNSNSECKIFKHNNLEHLESLLKGTDINRPKLIVFESLYSMEGTITKVDKYVELAKRYNALTYLDEVHAVGLYGENGQGVANILNVSNKIDIINGTLAKAFGVMGGYIASSEKICDSLRSYAPGFIFTTSLPPAIAAGAAASVAHLKVNHLLREQHQIQAKILKARLKAVGLPIIDHGSHILPVVVGDPVHTKKLSDMLLSEFGIYVQPINYPTVPRGTERLRFTPSPVHGPKEVDDLVQAMDYLWSHCALNRAELSA